jgi:hypothetical protein
MANTTVFTKSLSTAASANNIALSQSPGAAALTLNGAAVTGGIATIDTFNATTNSSPGRRVLITSGGDDHLINFLITGTNSSGNVVTDTVAGTNAGTSQSNIDFVTVTKIIGSGAIASTVTAGTNGVGSSDWKVWSWMSDSPLNIGYAVELVSGAVNYTVQYTYDDPNNLPAGVSFPLAFNTILLNQTATADSTLSTPFIATRVLINSGTGVIRIRAVQVGIG